MGTFSQEFNSNVFPAEALAAVLQYSPSQQYINAIAARVSQLTPIVCGGGAFAFAGKGPDFPSPYFPPYFP